VAPTVLSALETARGQGFLGDGSLDVQVAHSLGFAAALEAVAGSPPQGFVDLGSGGGLPGLVLAGHWPDSTAILIDANERRTRALSETVEKLGWSARVRVLRARAEDAGRDLELRTAQPAVVARSFGPPAVVAECAAPLLRLGGLLVVSEPPPAIDPAPPRTGPVGHPNRWPAEPLAQLGLRAVAFETVGFGYQVLQLESPCPERYPRRSGIPVKRPLFS
jgi:16S rRNA (guanine527-N7)-methyltransferase